jgi:hypothetical protein
MPSKVEEILPLSPLQEGMLFRVLYDIRGVDVYAIQYAYDLDGAVGGYGHRCRRWRRGTPSCGPGSCTGGQASRCRWSCVRCGCRGRRRT